METIGHSVRSELVQAANGRLRNIARHYRGGLLTDEDLEVMVYEVLAPLGHTCESIDACIDLIMCGEQL